MVNEEYLNVAKSFDVLVKNRFKPERTPIEKETDQLFFWIFSQLNGYFIHSFTDDFTRSISISIKESLHTHVKSEGRVILEFGKFGCLGSFISWFVTKKEDFYTVMENVANIINEIGDTMVPGASYHAFYIPPTESKEASINVSYAPKITTG